MSFLLGFLTFICIVFVLFIAYLDYKSCIWVMVVTLGIYLLGMAEDHYLGRGFIKCAKITAILGIAVSVLSLFILKNSANLSLGDGYRFFLLYFSGNSLSC